MVIVVGGKAVKSDRMAMLIVDDSPAVCQMINLLLEEAGYTETLLAYSGQEALQRLGLGIDGDFSPGATADIDLILLDIVLPDMDGREACRLIKSAPEFQDIPVIMVTALTDKDDLARAFAEGAMDYITKPVNGVELLARIRSALRLKEEMGRRRAREQELLGVTRQLEAAVSELNRLSTLDGLTGVANRRRFDEYLDAEWRRGRRNARPLSLIMLDVDFFKAYNDFYGHQAGDGCLRLIARALEQGLSRPCDLVCRYGGEEFAAILPETTRGGAVLVAEALRTAVSSLNITHEESPVSDRVTISLGVATLLPAGDMTPEKLVVAADRALYQAKRDGRNRVTAWIN